MQASMRNKAGEAVQPYSSAPRGSTERPFQGFTCH